jgi:hypothetical protein
MKAVFRDKSFWFLLPFACFCGAALGHAGLIPKKGIDPEYVSHGPNHGYYVVSSNSGKWWDWGLGRAPVVEPTRFTAGYGDDVVAVSFNSNGRVAYSPVYIYTIRPDSYQERRLDAVTVGVTSEEEVRQIFGRPDIQGAAAGHKVWFYQIRVYNPFEEFPDLR